MIPNPQSIQRNLGLIGRFAYVMIKSKETSTPLSFHIDIKMNDTKQTIRVSASNLYKQFSTQNGNVI